MEDPYLAPPVPLGEFLAQHPDQLAIVNASVTNTNPNAFVEPAQAFQPAQAVKPIVSLPTKTLRVADRSRRQTGKVKQPIVSPESESDEEEAFRDSEDSITYSESTDDESDLNEVKLPEFYPIDVVRITGGIAPKPVFPSTNPIKVIQVNPVARPNIPQVNPQINPTIRSNVVQVNPTARPNIIQVNPQINPVARPNVVQPNIIQSNVIQSNTIQPNVIRAGSAVPNVINVRPTNPQVITYIPPRI